MLPEGQTHGTILQPYDTKVNLDDQAHGPYHHTLAYITFLNCINLITKALSVFPSLASALQDKCPFLPQIFLFFLFLFLFGCREKWLKLGGVFEASNSGRYDFYQITLKNKLCGQISSITKSSIHYKSGFHKGNFLPGFLAKNANPIKLLGSFLEIYDFLLK